MLLSVSLLLLVGKLWRGLVMNSAILNLSNMADTQELQRLALVANIMDRSLSMPDTDDCVADLRRLNRYHAVYILTK